MKILRLHLTQLNFYLIILLRRKKNLRAFLIGIFLTMYLHYNETRSILFSVWRVSIFYIWVFLLPAKFNAITRKFINQVMREAVRSIIGLSFVLFSLLCLVSTTTEQSKRFWCLQKPFDIMDSTFYILIQHLHLMITPSLKKIYYLKF